MSTNNNKLCRFNCANEAVRLMPQSIDGGVTVDFVPACEFHTEGWWDGADWDGRHLEQPIGEGSAGDFR